MKRQHFAQNVKNVQCSKKLKMLILVDLCSFFLLRFPSLSTKPWNVSYACFLKFEFLDFCCNFYSETCDWTEPDVNTCMWMSGWKCKCSQHPLPVSSFLHFSTKPLQNKLTVIQCDVNIYSHHAWWKNWMIFVAFQTLFNIVDKFK